ncbi:MAG TPA: hypothetical protein DCZ87_04535 [Chitinophagaceae bacterium]|jgi:hypothetical protein|nr:hypothetical protein [Bacteroidota bacterium]HBB57926.1 hypothetical protein [Chitinophagaceae bacterium]
MKGLTEGTHFYYNEEGLVVLTEAYHLEKGYCCGNGCKHCPYDFESVPEPRRSQLQKEKESSQINS